MSCTWPVSYTCLPDVTSPEDTARLQAAVDAAVTVLWSFTGRQYGCCPLIVRPCPQQREHHLFWIPGYAWYPVLDAGVWQNIACACGPTCTVGGPGVVHLPGPVCSVTEVKIDGATVDSSAWVLEGDQLYAASGQWPSQDLSRQAGSPGTWSVEFLQGYPPPAGAAAAVGALALEFWKLCRGEKCRLPRGVESVSRQGVSMKIADPTALFENFQTGIPEVDLWITAVNPHRLAAPPAVLSPDYRGGA
jgi:hypothetical protein